MPSSCTPSTSTNTNPPTWDIFCRVIDNFGDIGVCWRLARQLAKDYPIAVRLWVDELEPLVRIWPSAQYADQQFLENVEVRIWREDFDPQIKPAEVVIEAFACEIPATYQAAMALLKQESTAPVWLNLEYLSAEDWVNDCHKMQSVSPSSGLRKTFFFPGFTPSTGGLLRENQLIERMEQVQPQDCLRQLGIEKGKQGLLISLFAYENSAMGELLSTWEESASPIQCLVPEGKVLASINTYFETQLGAGESLTRGNLQLDVIPFVEQLTYDQLLWACDINFVRGEDSFVRAQWAGKPMVWHIYPQDEDAHLLKLEAFLHHYLQDSRPSLGASVQRLWHGWNQHGPVQEHWHQCIAQLSEWQALAHKWRDQLLKQPDLAAQLWQFTNP